MLGVLPKWALHLGVTMAALGFLLVVAASGPPGDFCTYFTAGHLVLTGDADAPYDFEAINVRHRELHPEEGLRVGSFLYSPLFLPVIARMSTLPFESALFVNQLLILLSLGGLLFLLLQSTESRWLKALLTVIFVISDPVTNQFIYQNWSAPLALFVGLAVFFTLRDRHIPAALSWALAIHLKAYIGLFLLPLLVVGRRRQVLEVLAAGLILIVVSLPFVGTESYVTYLEAMREQSEGWVTYFFNQVSVQSTIARYEFPPSRWPSSTVAPSLALLDWLIWLSLPICALLVFRLRHDPPRALALTVPYLLLFVPKVWDHTQILFFVVFLTGALVRRTKAILLAYLALSFAYFPLVQHLLTEAIRGTGGTGIVHGLLLYYPVLNVLAAVAIVSPPETSVKSRR